MLIRLIQPKFQEEIDTSFFGNTLKEPYNLKVHIEDFTTAKELLRKFYAVDLNEIDKDYYLFDLSDVELKDILYKPDDWSELDYNIARKILENREVYIDDYTIERKQLERYKELSEPDDIPILWIAWAYLLALNGGFMGIFIANHIMHSKKVLPNGEFVFTYSTKDRENIKYLLYLGYITLFTFFILFLTTL